MIKHPKTFKVYDCGQMVQKVIQLTVFKYYAKPIIINLHRTVKQIVNSAIQKIKFEKKIASAFG